jgi:hypothetical protein
MNPVATPAADPLPRILITDNYLGTAIAVKRCILSEFGLPEYQVKVAFSGKRRFTVEDIALRVKTGLFPVVIIDHFVSPPDCRYSPFDGLGMMRMLRNRGYKGTFVLHSDLDIEEPVWRAAGANHYFQKLPTDFFQKQRSGFLDALPGILRANGFRDVPAPYASSGSPSSAPGLSR